VPPSALQTSRGCIHVSIEKSSNRLLKKAASFVLGSTKSSTYPRGYASGFVSPAAALDGLFEQPAVTTAELASTQALISARNDSRCTFAQASSHNRKVGLAIAHWAVLGEAGFSVLHVGPSTPTL
jgi:hypothetical protein